jgi:hypothetical protein
MNGRGGGGTPKEGTGVLRSMHCASAVAFAERACPSASSVIRDGLRDTWSMCVCVCQSKSGGLFGLDLGDTTRTHPRPRAMS